MTLSLLEFSQKCLRDIDYEFLTLFDLKKGQDASFSTYPEEWGRRYLSRKYYEHDYVHLKNLLLPVVWGEAPSKDINPLQRQIFKEAQDFQIYKGITIPFITSNDREFITLAFHKKDKLSNKKIYRMGADLQVTCQMIFTYKHLLESKNETQESALQFIEEVSTWQKNAKNQKKNKDDAVSEILSDIRSAQMFITHHETKELGLETLHRVYRDIERLD